MSRETVLQKGCTSLANRFGVTGKGEKASSLYVAPSARHWRDGYHYQYSPISRALLTRVLTSLVY